MKNNFFVFRDGSKHLADGWEYNGELEVAASEFIIMNNSIKALSEIIAVTPNSNMEPLNKTMENDWVETNLFFGKNFTFKTNCLPDRYGSTGLIIKANSTTYYTYASKTATITVDGGIKSASEGVYKDGKWVKTKDVEVVDGVVTYEPGKAYQLIV